MLFHDMEYKFTFFDPNTGSVQNIIGLVKAIYENQIKILYTTNSTNNCTNCPRCNECSNSTTNKNQISEGMPTCSCVLNPPDYSNKYAAVSSYFIPVSNIIDVSYITYISSNDNNDSEESKEDIHVMLLGISATIVKAIVIRLGILDDSIQDAVRYVELKTGGIYDLAYECKDGTIFESRVKVVKIEEDDDIDSNCKPGKGFVREHVGCHDAIYTTRCKPRDEFMNVPPVRRVRITVDTSETFNGRYEVIPLSAIRDCVLVQGPEEEELTGTTVDCCEGCYYRTEDCNPCNCGHYIEPPKKPDGCGCMTPNTYTYVYDNMYKVTVTGECATISIKGDEHQIPLNEVFKYYLGVDDANCNCPSK